MVCEQTWNLLPVSFSLHLSLNVTAESLLRGHQDPQLSLPLPHALPWHRALLASISVLVCSLVYCLPAGRGASEDRDRLAPRAASAVHTGAFTHSCHTEACAACPQGPCPFPGKLPALKQAQRVAGEAVLSLRPTEPDQRGRPARDPSEEAGLAMEGSTGRTRLSCGSQACLEKSPQGVLTLTSAPSPGRAQGAQQEGRASTR